MPTRAEAREAGLTHYDGGRPCRRGHPPNRYTSTGCCVACAALASQVQAQDPKRKARRRTPEYRQAVRARYADGGQVWITALCAAAMQRAQKAKIPFERAAVVAALEEMGTHCPALGLTFAIGARTDASPSVDRFDPARGYVQGNVVVISALANRIKSSATPEQVAQVGEWMLDYRAKRG